jgi:pimeloyl-ACP methyl ester carboxylesterase
MVTPRPYNRSMARQPAIAKQMVTTSFGNIAYLEAGGAPRPPVLLVHGIPTSSYLWRQVLPELGAAFHCYAPDLMGLGDTEVDLDGGRFDMEAQARMLVDFMSRLGHESFAVVCHDQGGAAAQLIAAHHPERITCLVLTNCVCYDNWPVPVIRRQQRLSRVPVIAQLVSRLGLVEWIETQTRLSAFRRGVYDPARLSDEAIREYLRPARGTPAQQARFRAFLLAGDPRYTMDAVDGLRRFERPTMVLWAADDAYLSPAWGRRLHEDIPGARRFELVPRCGHFWPEEKPAEFSAYIRDFFREHLPDRPSGARVHLPVVPGQAADRR